MRHAAASLCVLGLIALQAGGCSFADANAPFVPEALRYKPAEPKAEIIPDIKAIVRERTNEVFSSRLPPANVRVSLPRRTVTGLGWTSCVRAEIAGVAGKSIGTHTYILTIDANGKIGDRRLADASPLCMGESYEPA